jgi:hypothetical protein
MIPHFIESQQPRSLTKDSSPRPELDNVEGVCLLMLPDWRGM